MISLTPAFCLLVFLSLGLICSFSHLFFNYVLFLEVMLFGSVSDLLDNFLYSLVAYIFKLLLSILHIESLLILISQSVHLLSCVRLFATPWTAVRQASLSITRVYSNSCPLRDAIQPSHPLSSPSPPAFSLSQHQSLFQ